MGMEETDEAIFLAIRGEIKAVTKRVEQLERRVSAQGKLINALERQITLFANEYSSDKNNDEELKPCPWCGEKTLYANNSDEYPYIRSNGKPIRITCVNCECSSPSAPTEDMAWRNWDKRKETS